MSFRNISGFQIGKAAHGNFSHRVGTATLFPLVRLLATQEASRSARPTVGPVDTPTEPDNHTEVGPRALRRDDDATGAEGGNQGHCSYVPSPPPFFDEIWHTHAKDSASRTVRVSAGYSCFVASDGGLAPLTDKPEVVVTSAGERERVIQILLDDPQGSLGSYILPVLTWVTENIVGNAASGSIADFYKKFHYLHEDVYSNILNEVFSTLETHYLNTEKDAPTRLLGKLLQASTRYWIILLSKEIQDFENGSGRWADPTKHEAISSRKEIDTPKPSFTKSQLENVLKKMQSLQQEGVPPEAIVQNVSILLERLRAQNRR